MFIVLVLTFWILSCDLPVTSQVKTSTRGKIGQLIAELQIMSDISGGDEAADASSPD